MLEKTVNYRLFLAILIIGLVFAVSKSIMAAPACVDVGFVVREAGGKVSICGESGNITSPLRISKAGIIYGLQLVDPSDPAATKTMIRLASGITKALKKYIPDEESNNYLLFTDSLIPLTSSCDFNTTSWRGTLRLVNNSAFNIQFNKLRTSGYGGSPNTIIIPPNTTKVASGFGFLSYPDSGCMLSEVPDARAIDGSVTYSVSQNGITTQEVTYYWQYPH